MRRNQKWIAWIIGAALVAVLAFEGHRLAHFLPRIEHFVETLGPWGPLSYVAAIVALEPLLFPNSLFGLTAGVVFGFPRGLLYYASGVYLGNLLVYWMGKRFLRRPVLDALRRRPKVQATMNAAKQEGTSLVFWLRMLPLNPALFSYAFGAVELPLRAVALGSFGMLSHLILDVYIGTVAAHVTEMAGRGHTQWEMEGIGLVGGLVAIGIVFWRVARIAKAQVREAGVSLDL
ncbi:MAG: VTT domain-containing protein [Myxococcales bacterium]|nr:VTT domain-containing protein [Myxococcales bacterium]MDH3483206.1 VTT domain-containing protein [Myxococcales bacterium]